MKNLMSSVIFTLLQCFVSSFVLAESEFTIVSEEYPPYEYLEDGKPVGQDVEILQEAAKIAGIKISYQFFPWERATDMVKKGNADAIISLFKNEERSAFLYFPETPLSYEKNVIFANKFFSGDIKNLDDLKGKTVGIMSGYSYGEFDNYKDAIKEEAFSQKILLNKLKGNRYQLVVNNELVTFFMLKSLDIEKSEFRELSYVIGNDPLFIGFSKASPAGENFFNLISGALKQMESSGQLAQIRNKYL